MRAVLDTDVMVAAIRSDAGASRRLLRAALRRQYVMLLSVPLAIRYEAVMTRREHLAAARLTVDDVRILLDAVISVAVPVRMPIHGAHGYAIPMTTWFWKHRRGVRNPWTGRSW